MTGMFKSHNSVHRFLFLLQELLKKCHQCMETIVKAKDQQAAEANKNASILLKELDLEKVMTLLLCSYYILCVLLTHGEDNHLFLRLCVCA